MVVVVVVGMNQHAVPMNVPVWEEFRSEQMVRVWVRVDLLSVLLRSRG